MFAKPTLKRRNSAVIGIQARSNSSRLPNKALIPFGNKTALDHVMDACNTAREYLTKDDIRVDVALLVPEDDPIVEAYKNKILIIPGSEKNVLSRYVALSEILYPDYIVRITGDCYVHSPRAIATHIRTAVRRDADYTSNVDPRFRTAIDGHDVEVMSHRMLDWAKRHALTDYDREHVTTVIRRAYPDWAKYVHLITDLDLSEFKFSVDTKEDFDYVASIYHRTKSKKEALVEQCSERNHSYFVY